MADPTDVSLRDFIDAKLSALEAKLDAYSQVMNTKICNVEDRTRDMSVQFLTRKEHDAWKVNVENALAELHDFKTEIKSKASQSSMWLMTIISILALGVSLAKLFIK